MERKYVTNSFNLFDTFNVLYIAIDKYHEGIIKKLI